MRMNVGQAFSPALDYMVAVLFKPFNLRKWLAWGFIAFLFGGWGHSSNFRMPANIPSQQQRHGYNSSMVLPLGHQSGPQLGSFCAMNAYLPPPDVQSGTRRNPSMDGWPGASPSDPFSPSPEEVLTYAKQHWQIVLIVGILLLALGLVSGWLNSIFNLVYAHDVSTDTDGIREPFHRLKPLGNSYFLWQLGVGLLTMLLLTPFCYVCYTTVFGKSTGNPTGVLVLLGIDAIVTVFLMAIIQEFAWSFVIPTMYVKGIKVLGAWRTILPILRANIGQLILYILILIGVGIASVMYALVAMLVVAIVAAIPVGILALIGYAIYNAAGSSVSPALIAVASVVTIAVGLAISWLLSAAMQPVYVFKRVFSMMLLGQADPSLAAIPVRTSQETRTETS